MINKFFFSTLLLAAFIQAHSQSKVNLGRPVNNPLSNDRNPSISGNGKYMVFETDYGDERLYPVIARQAASMWSRPEELSGLYNKTTNDKDWNLNYDGSVIFFSSARYGGVGNSDIWMSRKQGDKWAPPVNLAKPVNSTAPEISPSISADDKKLYFVRLNGKKSPSGMECGTIMISELKANTWSEPVTLPSPINTGCECSPKILSDNRTLVFASARENGKGGFDLYKSVLQPNGQWSSPIPLSFVNTEKDDLYISIPEKGEYAIITATEHDKDDLFKIKLSENFLPQKHLVLHSTVNEKNSQKTIAAKIQISTPDNPAVINELYTEGSSGKFKTVLAGNDTYEVTILPMAKGYFHETLIFNNSTPAPEFIGLTSLKTGNTMELSRIDFTPGAEIKPGKEELDKIVKTLKDNPEVSVEIAVHTKSIQKDTIQRDDLTEVDSTVSIKTKILRRTANDESIPLVDTVIVNEVSLIYHNNRTQREAESIRSYLSSKGISPERLKAVGYGDMHNKVAGNASRKVELIVL